MKKTMLLMAILMTGALLLFQPAGAQEKRHRGTTISTNGEKNITDCSQIRMEIGDGETVRSQLVQSVPRSAAPTLQVTASKNGGIHVQGWNGSDYAITACLAAAGDTGNDAKDTLDQIKLSVRDGKVTVEGPSSQDWFAFLIIQAPNGSSLDLESGNGPVAVADFSGTIQAKNVNGPITFRGVTGQVKADVQNGPITVAGSGGDFRLTAQNGPLTVSLDGLQWQGGELEGRTQNGPLTVKLPENYMSPVRIDASKHSPIQCKAVQCKEAVRTWDRPSVIEFGGPSPVIRLSTINGPVTVTQGDK
jgi:hypothetical protein